MKILNCNSLTYIGKRPSNSLIILCELNMFIKETKFVYFKQNCILFIYSKETGFNRFKMKLTFSKQHFLCYEHVIDVKNDVHLSFNSCLSFDFDFYLVFTILKLLETWSCPKASAMHMFAIKNYIHHDLKKMLNRC